ncbi:hypothetical protein ACJW30_08G066400 [Castanea mollissima]
MQILLPPFFIIFVQILTMATNTCQASTLPKFPAILIFGDSSVDTGNNNYINTIFQSNHYPYGINFPGQVPTGRFSDGKIPSDLLANMLGIKESVPPFLNPNLSNDELRAGVYFASTGSGLKGVVGKDKASKIIHGSVVSISAGTNDFGISFYTFPIRSQQVAINQYQNFVLEKLKDFVKELYKLGLRYMLIGGLPPMGCLPNQITARCKSFNGRKYSKYHYQGVYSYTEIRIKPLMDMIHNPQKYGFVETNRGCCGTGFVETALLCNINTPPCGNLPHFLFWNSVHPSQAGYQHVAKYLKKTVLPFLLKHHGL